MIKSKTQSSFHQETDLRGTTEMLWQAGATETSTSSSALLRIVLQRLLAWKTALGLMKSLGRGIICGVKSLEAQA